MEQILWFVFWKIVSFSLLFAALGNSFYQIHKVTLNAARYTAGEEIKYSPDDAIVTSLLWTLFVYSL